MSKRGKGGVAMVTWPRKNLCVANSSVTAKDTNFNFKFGTHDPRESPDKTTTADNCVNNSLFTTCGPFSFVDPPLPIGEFVGGLHRPWRDSSSLLRRVFCCLPVLTVLEIWNAEVSCSLSVFPSNEWANKSTWHVVLSPVHTGDQYLLSIASPLGLLVTQTSILLFYPPSEQGC